MSSNEQYGNEENAFENKKLNDENEKANYENSGKSKNQDLKTYNDKNGQNKKKKGKRNKKKNQSNIEDNKEKPNLNNEDEEQKNNEENLNGEERDSSLKFIPGFDESRNSQNEQTEDPQNDQEDPKDNEDLEVEENSSEKKEEVLPEEDSQDIANGNEQKMEETEEKQEEIEEKQEEIEEKQEEIEEKQEEIEESNIQETGNDQEVHENQENQENQESEEKDAEKGEPEPEKEDTNQMEEPIIETQNQEIPEVQEEEDFSSKNNQISPSTPEKEDEKQESQPEETKKESDNPEVKNEAPLEGNSEEKNDPEYSNEKEKLRQSEERRNNEVSHEIVKDVSYEGKDNTEFINHPENSQLNPTILERPEESIDQNLLNTEILETPKLNENTEEHKPEDQSSLQEEYSELKEVSKDPEVPEKQEATVIKVGQENEDIKENQDIEKPKILTEEAEKKLPEQTKTESELLSPSKRIELANKLKEKAKQPIAAKEYSSAKALYEEALYVIHPSHFAKATEADYKEMINLSCLLMNNLVFCFLNLEIYDEAIRFADRVIISDPNNVKAHYRKSIAFRKKGDTEKAWENIKKATVIARKSGHNVKEVEVAFEEIKEEYKHYMEANKEKEKEFYSKMLNSSNKDATNESSNNTENISSNSSWKYLYILPSLALGIFGSYNVMNKGLKSSNGALFSFILSFGIWGVFASKDSSKKIFFTLLTSLIVGLGKVYIKN